MGRVVRCRRHDSIHIGLEGSTGITELAGHLNAAHYRWLTLIAEFDRRKGWADSGCVSCAHWLNFKCGVALGAAREKVRVARALEQLPKLAAEMARGAVSYSKAGRCEIEEATSLPAETVRRLACDCSVVAVIENERGEPLNVGRRTRSIPPALRRALNARDRGCRFPGCTHTRYVDAHHVRHWAHGGETKASNLVTLCRFHHRKVHEGGVAVQVLDDGAFRFVKPDGTGFNSVATGRTTPLGDWTQLPRRHCEEGVHIDSSTAVTLWRGENMDYGIAVDALLARSRTVPAVAN